MRRSAIYPSRFFRNRFYDQLEREGAPEPWLAFHAYVATHHLHQASCDAQAQPGPTVEPRCRTVRLSERLENHVLLLRRDSDTRIAHRETQLNLISLELPLGNTFLAKARFDGNNHFA